MFHVRPAGFLGTQLEAAYVDDDGEDYDDEADDKYVLVVQEVGVGHPGGLEPGFLHHLYLPEMAAKSVCITQLPLSV